MGDEFNSRVSSRQIVHRGAKFDLEVLTFAGTDGRPVRREVVRHPGAALIVPILDGVGGGARRVVLIRNERPAVGGYLYEFPAGTLAPPEPPEACARRELREETGYEAATLTPLGRFHTAPGMTDELMWAYVAQGLTHVGQRLEPDERLTVEIVETDEAWAMLDRGDLMDAKSMIGLLLASRRGFLSGGAGGEQGASGTRGVGTGVRADE